MLSHSLIIIGSLTPSNQCLCLGQLVQLPRTTNIYGEEIRQLNIHCGSENADLAEYRLLKLLG